MIIIVISIPIYDGRYNSYDAYLDGSFLLRSLSIVLSYQYASSTIPGSTIWLLTATGRTWMVTATPGGRALTRAGCRISRDTG